MRHVNADQIDAPAACMVDRGAMHPYDVDMSVLKNCWSKSYTLEEIKLMRGSYWGAVGEAMGIVDNVFEAARDSGHLHNSIVIYTSDHGEMSMEHRMDYKNSLREPSLRVPLIITPFHVPSLAGFQPKVHACNLLVSPCV